MPFGIELLFDPSSEKKIKNIWLRLEKKGLPTPLYRDNPHVTLAAFDKGRLDLIEAHCRKVAHGFSELPFSFESIGSFTREGVLFLAPTVTLELLTIHQKIHHVVRGLVKNQSSFYLPGILWAPHCTLALAKSNGDYLKGFKTMREIPIGWKGHFTRLEVHEYEIKKETYSRRIRMVFSIPFQK